jgi:hypothetical protein
LKTPSMRRGSGVGAGFMAWGGYSSAHGRGAGAGSMFGPIFWFIQIYLQVLARKVVFGVAFYVLISEKYVFLLLFYSD